MPTALPIPVGSGSGYDEGEMAVFQLIEDNSIFRRASEPGASAFYYTTPQVRCFKASANGYQQIKKERKQKMGPASLFAEAWT